MDGTLFWMPNLKFKSWMDSNRRSHWGGVVWWRKGRGNWMMPKGYSRWRWGHAHSTSLKYHVCSCFLRSLLLKLSWISQLKMLRGLKTQSLQSDKEISWESTENPFQECLLLSWFCSVINEFCWESAENLLRIWNLSFFQHFCWTAVHNQKTAVSLHSRFFFLVPSFFL